MDSFFVCWWEFNFGHWNKFHLTDLDMNRLIHFTEESTKPLKEKLEKAKSIRVQIQLLESSTDYLSLDQIKNLKSETDEKIKKAREINSSLEKLMKDPDFLKPKEVKKLGQNVQRLKNLV